MIIPKQTISNIDHLFEEFTEVISKAGYAVAVDARSFNFSYKNQLTFSIDDLRAVFFDHVVWRPDATSFKVEEEPSIISGKLHAMPFYAAAADINKNLSYASASEEEETKHLGFSWTISLPLEKAEKRLMIFWEVVAHYIALPATDTYCFAAERDTLFSCGWGDLWEFCYIFLDKTNGRGIVIAANGYDITA